MKISAAPAPICHTGSVIVSSGSMTAKRQRLKSVVMPRFVGGFTRSFVMTAESLVSLPAAAMVSTVPIGRLRVISAFFIQKSQIGTSGAQAPCATALAVSITLPPPTARIKSAPNFTASPLIRSAILRHGFGTTPPEAMTVRPASSRFSVSRPMRPLLTAECPP